MWCLVCFVQGDESVWWNQHGKHIYDQTKQLVQQNNIHGALELYDVLSTHLPNSIPVIHTNRVILTYGLDPKKAYQLMLSTSDRFVQDEKTQSKACVTLVQWYKEQTREFFVDPYKVQEICRKALALNPVSEQVAEALADILVLTKDFFSAIEFLQGYFQQTPSRSRGLVHSLSTAFLYSGRFEDALSTLRKADPFLDSPEDKFEHHIALSSALRVSSINSGHLVAKHAMIAYQNLLLTIPVYSPFCTDSSRWEIMTDWKVDSLDFDVSMIDLDPPHNVFSIAMNNAFLIGPDGIIVRNCRIYGGGNSFSLGKNLAYSLSFLREKSKKVKRTTFSLLQTNLDNHFHVLLEALPKFLLIERIISAKNIEDFQILIPTESTRLKEALLFLLSLSNQYSVHSNHLVVHNSKRGPFEFQDLRIVDWINSNRDSDSWSSFYAPASTIEHLSKQFSSFHKRGKIVFITRSFGSARFIPAQDSIIQALSESFGPHHVIRFDGSRLSLSDQAE